MCPADGLGKALEHVKVFAPAGDMVLERANDRVVEQKYHFFSVLYYLQYSKIDQTFVPVPT
jgi:hypothetical protein